MLRKLIAAASLLASLVALAVAPAASQEPVVLRLNTFPNATWARANGPLLERFLAAYIEATRMALAPANRAQAISLIAAQLKQDPGVAQRTYDEALTQPGGLAPDAKLDVVGFKAVLQLRAEIEGQWDGKPPPPERYFDLGYYERAMRLLSDK